MFLPSPAIAVEVADRAVTAKPPTATVQIDGTSDTLPLGDDRTEFSVVTLSGNTAPGSLIFLRETRDTAIANAEGYFQFRQVKLQPGINAFTFEIVNLEGESSIVRQQIVRLRELRGRFDRLVVFGNSLSDTGNLGRSSNGWIWVDYLSDRLGLETIASSDGGTNYAHSGATAIDSENTIDLNQQFTQFYQSDNSISEADLYAIAIGGNDVVGIYESDTDASDRLNATVDRIISVLDRLVDGGAKNIVILNAIDGGFTPLAHQENASEQITDLVQQFNDRLETAVRDFSRDRPQIDIEFIDLFSLSHAIVESPQRFGLPDNFIVGEPCPQTPCDNYFFWDGVHPTTQTHAAIANWVYVQLADD